MSSAEFQLPQVVCNCPSPCMLWSVDSPTLPVPSTRRATLGDRAFPVAAARAWNSLPPQTRTASILFDNIPAQNQGSFCLTLSSMLVAN